MVLIVKCQDILDSIDKLLALPNPCKIPFDLDAKGSKECKIVFPSVSLEDFITWINRPINNRDDLSGFKDDLVDGNCPWCDSIVANKKCVSCDYEIGKTWEASTS